MRAISLWQPWASAIPLRLKEIETRSWSTDYRGPLAIHAAQRWTREERDFWASAHGVPAILPLGAIVAVVNLSDVRPTEELEPTITPLERRFGNYEAGRFGWILTDIRALPVPVPFKGRQGFFNVPDELLKGGI